MPREMTFISVNENINREKNNYYCHKAFFGGGGGEYDKSA